MLLSNVKYTLLYYLIIINSILLITDALISPNCNKIEDFAVVFQRKLNGDGFHRHLKTNLNITYKNGSEIEHLSDFLLDEAVVLIREIIPTGLYVNPYELQTENTAQFSVSLEVNVETPEYQSNSIKLDSITRVIDGKAQLGYKIHARYHKPQQCQSDASKFIALSLHDIPKVYIRIPNTMSCRGEVFKCKFDSAETCTWLPLQTKLAEPIPQLRIPVGCFEHLMLVSIVTTFATVGGGLCVVKTILTNKSKSKEQ